MKSPTSARVSFLRMLKLLRNLPPPPLTQKQFAAIQARVWERVSYRLDILSPSRN